MAEKHKNPTDRVQQLQPTLWMCAKRSRRRRFHALYDRIYRRDVLVEARKRVRVYGGSAGVDKQTIADIEQQGMGEFLKGIEETFRAGEYRLQPVRRRYIQKADG